MRPHAIHLLLLASLLLGGAFSASAQDPGPRRDRTAAEERWRSLSPEKREQLRRRHEAFRSMDEAQQAEMRRRFQRVREEEQRVQREMPAHLRRRMQGLDPAERRELLHEHLSEGLNERGRCMRDLLPDEVRAELEGATPDERRRLLKDIRERYGREKLDRTLRDLGTRLGLPEEEIQALAALPLEVKREQVLSMRRAEIQLRIEAEGLPAWLSAEDWSAWSALPDREFTERFRRAEFAARDGDRPLAALRDLMRPDPGSFEDLIDLPREERRSEIARRARERVFAYLAEHPDTLTPDEVQGLRELDDRAFMERLRGHCSGDRRRGKQRGDGGRRDRRH